MSIFAALLLLAAAAEEVPGVSGGENAIDRLAREVAAQLKAPAGALVVSSRSATPAGELFAERLAGALGADGRRASVIAPAEDEGAARAAGAHWLVRARLAFTDSEVVAWAELRALQPSFWSGEVPSGAQRTAYARAPADADLRALARARAEFIWREMGRLAETPFACAIGDLDGDGRGEIAVVFADRAALLDQSLAERAVVGLRPVRAVRVLQRAAQVARGQLIVHGNDLSSPPVWQPPGPASARGDLDGDGVPEEIRTLPVLAGEPDRARVVKAGNEGVVVFQTPPVDRTLEGACAGDLDGDGRDEAVVLGRSKETETTLYLLEAP
jgi:hypothetical protein